MRSAPAIRCGAPAAGALLGFTGWNSGMYVAAGQVLGTVSPEDALLVETQVASRDIGLVRPRPAGAAAGRCLSLRGVGDDRRDRHRHQRGLDCRGRSRERTAGFQGHGAPSRMDLKLAGGARGELKKGLTLSARFLVPGAACCSFCTTMQRLAQPVRPAPHLKTFRQFRRGKTNTNMNEIKEEETPPPPWGCPVDLHGNRWRHDWGRSERMGLTSSRGTRTPSGTNKTSRKNKEPSCKP